MFEASVMSKKDSEIFEFEGFTLNVAERYLVRVDRGERVALSDKAFETLCVLVRNAGHLVQKDELLNQVWAGSFVEENNLNKTIHAIRRALGEKSGEDKYVETVLKHGFRFVADVTRIEQGEGATRTFEVSDEPEHKDSVSDSMPQSRMTTSGAHAIVNLAEWRNVVERVEGRKDPPMLVRDETDALPIAEKQAAETQAAVTLLSGVKRSYLTVAAAVGVIAVVLLTGYFFAFRTPATAAKRSIAVLPLKPINSANRDELYEIGIADSLINRLGSMKGFVVRPLSAMRKYADIEQDAIAAGREQQVDYVLASNYQLADGKIKITAQLSDVASGQIEETYKSEKDAGDLFKLQDAIAAEIGNIMLARFVTTSSGPTAKRGTTNEEAYRLYMQGKNLTFNRTVAGARKAVESFEQAVKLDPNYAPGYAGMAHALIDSGNLGGDLPSVEYERAKQAVTKALELDNNLAEGYAVLGELKFTYEWDFAEAEKDLLRAVELNPNDDLAHERYAFYLAIRGRFDEAISEAKTAQEINPHSLQHQHQGGVILYLARRYDEAILQNRRVIEVHEDYATAYGWLWLAYEMKGDDAQAYEWFMKLQKRTNPERLELFQNAYSTAAWQGVRQKKFELDKLDEQKPGSNLYRLARQSAVLGEKEQAFAYLNKAIEKRHGQMTMLNVEPAFDSIRDDPRFDELVRKIGLK